jgi:hypothetical protein
MRFLHAVMRQAPLTCLTTPDSESSSQRPVAPSVFIGRECLSLPEASNGRLNLTASGVRDAKLTEGGLEDRLGRRGERTRERVAPKQIPAEAIHDRQGVTAGVPHREVPVEIRTPGRIRRRIVGEALAVRRTVGSVSFHGMSQHA